MIVKKYAVVLLNYNTVEDAIIAASSMVENAICDDYVICFVDGCSTRNNQIETFASANIHNSCILKLDENVGYARGNNAGIRYLLEKYKIEHFVIMNPDVEIRTKGLVDNLIDYLSTLDETYCGIQPLVWTPRFGTVAEMQTNIRRVYSYADCLIDSFYPFRKIFSRRFKRFTYYNERPYITPVDFEVPSGCFFIIKSNVFDGVGLFDERTFLYAEEIILGYKLRQKGCKFVLNPAFKVVHECGKSTGGNKDIVSKFVAKESIKALEIYLRYYLKCGKMKIMMVRSLFIFNYYMKKFLTSIHS